MRRMVDREKTVWSWHLVYHICATNSRLEERLPPMPWNHFVDEAVNVHKALSYERTPSLTKPAEARLLRLYMVANGIHFKCVVLSFSISNMSAKKLSWNNAHVPQPLILSRHPLYNKADPIDRAPALNISKWASSGSGFDAPVHFVLKTGSTLFADCGSVGGASMEELNAVYNHLIAGDLDKI